ncbi:NADH:flavin oxidoreductase/NADH oxidase [Bordetella sp. 2513F-2]
MANELPDRPLLFTPFRLRGLRLRNRVVVSPMQMYGVRDGRVGDWHLAHIGRFALGGAGLILMEATAVCPEGRSTVHDNGLWCDSQIEGYSRITALARAAGAAIGIQLQHAGRKASCQAPWDGFGPLGQADAARGETPWTAWGVTGEGWSEDYPRAHAITEPDIDYLLQCYTAAAQRADRAGFDVVEVHAAHGYLLHSFLSPLSNHRRDRHGGSLAARAAFPLAVARAVRSAWPADKPLLMRISAVDGVGIGWSMDDSIALAGMLKDAGVDAIDCSSGGMRLPTRAHLLPRSPGFQVPLAAALRRETGMPTLAVGLIREPSMAEAIIAEGQADLVALGREMLWNPNWPLHAAQALGADPDFGMWPREFGWWLARRSAAHSPPSTQAES